MKIMTQTEVIHRIESLTVRRLNLYIQQGWVAPATTSAEQRFSEIDVARLQFIEHLRMDMAINDAAVPVVLSLVDQIHGLRHQLKSIGQAIEQQDHGVRKAIVDAIRDATGADMQG